MTSTVFFTVLMNGITYGALLFVVASGLSLVYGLMHVVNMGHGSFYLFGAYAGYMTWKLTGSWWMAILGGGIVMGIVSYFIKKVLYTKSFGGREGSLLTLGISMILVDIVLLLSQGYTMAIIPPSYIAKSVDLGIIKYPGMRLFILLFAVVEMLVLYFAIQKTKFGQIVRAGVNDKDIVAALGIKINKMFTIVFVLAGILAGIGGTLSGSIQSFQVGNESTMQMFSLMVIIIGGQGSLVGTGIGAFLIGILDSFTKATVPNISAPIVFGSVLLVLAFKPTGLLGREARKR
ncbi:MAG: branched-chain amino acid ABC transporter permease [Oscillospiraceae bacterium]